MEQVSGLESRFCVVWKTQFPRGIETLSSSKFSVLGFQWNLEFRFFSEYPKSSFYEIALRASAPDGAVLQKLVNPFTVTTLLDTGTGNKLPHTCSVGTVRTTHHVLWKCYENGALIPGLKYRFLPKIICIFNDLPPQELPSNGDTIPLSTWIDMDLTTSLKLAPNLENLSFDFSNLLKDKLFSDVKLNCGDRTISVHRVVLAARSEVFAAMFQTKMVESQTGVVDVIDLDAQVLDLLLKYMYTGKIGDLSEDIIPSLYAASDKYAVQALKKACSDWMIRSLTEENCLGFLTLADTHSDVAFKDKVVSFLCSHEALLRSQVWVTFSEKHVKLANDVDQSFVKYKNTNEYVERSQFFIEFIRSRQRRKL